MENLHIAATNESPEIDFRYAENRLSIRGESYPENAMAFYSPIRASLQNYLEAATGGIEVDVALRYFNSSSTKIIRMLIGMLNAAAEAGKSVVVRWHHDPEDDMMAEFGLDLKEEFRALNLDCIDSAEALAA